MKNPKNTVWRIALFLLTVVCGLLMADRGENEFPVFACSEALSGESGSTGLLLQQNMWDKMFLLIWICLPVIIFCSLVLVLIQKK